MSQIPDTDDTGWMTWARPGTDYFRTGLGPGEDPASIMDQDVAERELEPHAWDFGERVLTGYRIPGGPEMKPFTVEVLAPDPDDNYPRTTYCVLASSMSNAREKAVAHYAKAQMLDEDVAGTPQTAQIDVLLEHAGTPNRAPWTDLRNAG
jgi:hypothetical protein